MHTRRRQSRIELRARALVFRPRDNARERSSFSVVQKPPILWYTEPKLRHDGISCGGMRNVVAISLPLSLSLSFSLSPSLFPSRASSSLLDERRDFLPFSTSFPRVVGKFDLFEKEKKNGIRTQMRDSARSIVEISKSLARTMDLGWIWTQTVANYSSRVHWSRRHGP